jgi:hypothetical protein
MADTDFFLQAFGNFGTPGALTAAGIAQIGDDGILLASQRFPITSALVTSGLGYTPLRPSVNLSDVSNPVTALSNIGGIGAATTDTLTHKTFDTAGTGNVLKIAGTQITAITGSGAVVLATSPTLVTPVLGAATGTSLTLTGDLTGANGLFSGDLTAGATHALGFASRSLFTAPADGKLKLTNNAGDHGVLFDLTTDGTLAVKTRAGSGDGTLTVATPTSGDNSTKAATTAFVATAISLGLTSVNVSGGTTGLTFSGGPITTTGTITLSGTLAVANGGTGVTSSTGTGSVVLSASPTFTGTVTGATIKADAVVTTATTVNAQTGTTYTLLSSDNGKTVYLNNAAAITVTVPSGLPAGFSCSVVQEGAGQVTLSASSTTLRNANGLKTRAQYSVVGLLYRTTDTYFVAGDSGT